MWCRQGHICRLLTGLYSDRPIAYDIADKDRRSATCIKSDLSSRSLASTSAIETRVQSGTDSRRVDNPSRRLSASVTRSNHSRPVLHSHPPQCCRARASFSPGKRGPCVDEKGSAPAIDFQIDPSNVWGCEKLLSWTRVNLPPLPQMLARHCSAVRGTDGALWIALFVLLHKC
ncbi:hypothetical protein IQ07DRAFT_64796 [Pyrenochaeta sp. DS3sAY3a]|nr:hypothetical protein IQ07DRAFT_64796 [Pyrenochaeta sp. DS3sAY3a]